jgi:hypothetical protein
MQNELDQFYLKQEEPFRSALLALRDMITQHHPEITTALKYGMPFFCFRGKMFCYLWMHKQRNQPYIGWVEGKHLNHPDLRQEKRARMKILLIDAEKDIPVSTINHLLSQAIKLYQNGTIQTKR